MTFKDNAAYQIFCGCNIVDKWHVPDHTKIGKFRSRSSEETQKRLANQLAHHAVKVGFGHPEDFDIDSTIQEANMTYLADSCLLKKLGAMCNKAAHFLNRTVGTLTKPLKVDMKKISSVAKEYFFLSRNSTKAVKNEKLKSLLKVVSREIEPVIKICEDLGEVLIKKVPWNQTIDQIRVVARQYLKDVKVFLEPIKNPLISIPTVKKSGQL